MTDQIPGAATAAYRIAVDVDKRLSTHEAVCAERYGGLEKRLARIEKILLSIAGLMILSLIGALYRAVGGP